MISEELAFRDSAVHRIDPRVRLVFALLLCFATALSGSFAAPLLALGCATGLVALSCLPLFTVARRLVPVNIFMLFLWLVLPFTHFGEPAFKIMGLAASKQGIELAALVTIKANTIVLFMVALVSTMSVAALGHAAHRLYFPEKLVHLLLLTYRYVFVLESEYRQLVRAAKMRSFAPASNLHTYKTYSYLAGMLLVRAHSRARRVHQAMVCRGFSGVYHCLDSFAFRKADWVWVGILSLFFMAMIGVWIEGPY
ncbi:MAG: cobalt ECF transporter T component CbiQ [Desulfatibacillaceae bacterium]|nr:cobalt ECF transporter T component CbiQ [Desulfatibacillaceae bacterium]